MNAFVESCFAWPTLPVTILLVLICVYWLLVMVGAADMELFDFDLELDVDADSSILDVGFVPLRFLNLGNVPTMLWLSIFAIAAWAVSITMDGSTKLESPGDVLQALALSGGIAVLATKVLTQPLRGRFGHVEPNRAKEIIGHTCVITTSEASPTFGEAQYATEGAPLQLTVRTVEETLAKGEVAEIFDFAPEENIYYVKKVIREA